MGPLLSALTVLARKQASSGIEMTLIIYIQKQLWASPTATFSRFLPSDETGRDDRRKLASLVLAEALVFGGREVQHRQGQPLSEDLRGIVTWIVRTVPNASPLVRKGETWSCP